MTSVDIVFNGAEAKNGEFFTFEWGGRENF
jgi:hypothetical protein